MDGRQGDVISDSRQHIFGSSCHKILALQNLHSSGPSGSSAGATCIPVRHIDTGRRHGIKLILTHRYLRSRANQCLLSLRLCAMSHKQGLCTPPTTSRKRPPTFLLFSLSLSLLLLLPQSVCQSICNTQCQADQLAALQQLYEDTNGLQWLNNTGWTSSASYCSWFGVTCCVSGIAATAHGPINCSTESAISAMVCPADAVM